MGQAILVGTRKGLFVLHGDDDRREWDVDDPLLPGWDVFHAIKHEDDLYVAANNWVYGATVQRSSDLGQTWERSEPLTLPEGSELAVEKAWHVEPGGNGSSGSAARRASCTDPRTKARTGSLSRA